jgi:hypothetical protein
MTDVSISPSPAPPSEPPLRGLRKWALVAELVAAAGVIVSLVFVGLQLMQGNALAREAAEQKQIEAIGNLFRIVAESPFLSEAIAKAEAGETLTPGEMVGFTSLDTYAQRTWEALYFQYRAGRVDPELWDAHRELARAIQNRPISQAVWAQQKQFFSKSYRDFRDSEVAAKAPGAPPANSNPPPARAPEQAASPAEAPKQ